MSAMLFLCVCSLGAWELSACFSKFLALNQSHIVKYRRFHHAFDFKTIFKPVKWVFLVSTAMITVKDKLRFKVAGKDTE